MLKICSRISHISRSHISRSQTLSLSLRRAKQSSPMAGSDQDEMMPPPPPPPPPPPAGDSASPPVSSESSESSDATFSVSYSSTKWSSAHVYGCGSTSAVDQHLQPVDQNLQGEVRPVSASSASSLFDKVQEVFNNIQARRMGIVNSLTKDLEVVYNECDAGNEYLCLFGLANTTWVVKALDWESPSSIPEPKLGTPEPKPSPGINFLQDKMTKEEWASSVAMYSDAWLFSLASYFASSFDKESRGKLLRLINELPTIRDVVEGVAAEPTKLPSPEGESSASKSKRARVD